MHGNKDTIYNCRVCGSNQGFEPWGEDGKPLHLIFAVVAAFNLDMEIVH